MWADGKGCEGARGRRSKAQNYGHGYYETCGNLYKESSTAW